MARIIKNNLGNIFVILVIFSLVTSWFYSGWPQIFKNPSVPPEIQETYASSTDFITAGTTTNWQIPSGVYSVTVKVWGAGAGGGAGGDVQVGGAGGGGGFIQDTIAVTPGESLIIVVGSYGVGALAGSSCGGSGATDGAGGGGGGYSAVKRSTTFLLIAGGGGGGGAGSEANDIGGAGGGGGTQSIQGVNGTRGAVNGGGGGGGGTSIGGGAAGSLLASGPDGTGGLIDAGGRGGDGGTGACNGAGGAAGNGGNGGKTGGEDAPGGGGGGGGYYGGGGGEAGGTAHDVGAGGGGGGSGLCSDGTCSAEFAGAGQTEGSSTDAYHNTARGAGGAGGLGGNLAGGDGENGQVVIVYNLAPSFTGTGPADSPDPVNTGQPVTFSGTAIDPESDTWYLAACKTNYVATTTPPTCAASQDYCVSASAAASNSANSCNWTSSGSGTQTWYTFACDSGNSLGIRCSSASTSDITINAVSVSISRTDLEGIISYGTVDVGSSTSTDPAGQNKTTTFQNNGNVAEKFSIKTGNAVNGTGWTAVSGTPGVNQFRHSFATTSPVTYWKVMGVDPAYEIASSSVAVSGTLNIYLKLETPSASDYVAKDITVTVFAEQAP